MSILIIGDIHFKPSNEKQTLILQNNIMSILANRKIEFVVILGDTLDRHGNIDMECYNRACDLFDMIISTGIHLFVLIGNHDRSNNKVYMTNRHPFRGYDRRTDITIVSRCITYNFQLPDKIIRICFVPFVPDGMYMQALIDCGINPMSIDVFFSHSEFKGCKINKLSKNECDIWPHSFPLNVSGHIHDKELVQPNLIYIGTPFQHTYADSDDKGLYIMNLASENYQLEKIMTTIPRKVIIKVNYEQLEYIQLDPNLDIRLDIYGPTTYVKELMRRPDMENKFANITKRYKDVPNEKINEIISKPDNNNFYQLFLEEVSKDEKMKIVHARLNK